jgi:hypothetical protein
MKADGSKVEETKPEQLVGQNTDEGARTHETILAAVRLDPGALKYAPEEMQRDRAVVLKAVREAGAPLSSIREEFRDDKEIVTAAVQRDGMALQDASPMLQADREVVLAAVMQNSQAIMHADGALRVDPSILEIARSGGLADSALSSQSQGHDMQPKEALPGEIEQQAPSSASQNAGVGMRSPQTEGIATQDVDQEQNQAKQEYDLGTAKREVESFVKAFEKSVAEKEQALALAEDACKNADGDEQRQTAQNMVTQAQESLAEAQRQLATYSRAASTLENLSADLLPEWRKQWETMKALGSGSERKQEEYAF